MSLSSPGRILQIDSTAAQEERCRSSERYKASRRELQSGTTKTRQIGGLVTTRTSASHPLLIAEIATRTGGRVGLTFCPGKKQRDAISGR